MKKQFSHISKQEFLQGELISAKDISEAVYNEIKKTYPDFLETSYLSTKELNKFRQQYVESLVKQEVGEVTELEKEVVEKLNTNKFISGNVKVESEHVLTTGQKLADKIASFGGSWRFIISFLVFMLVWISINVFVLASKAYDPYPFILLNLILSCLAALQAPVIMMSQNRKEEKDRIRNEHDYQVNLSAELQIRMLHEKIDHLMLKQHSQMLQVQELQIELMEEIESKIDKLESKNK